MQRPFPFWRATAAVLAATALTACQSSAPSDQPGAADTAGPTPAVPPSSGTAGGSASQTASQGREVVPGLEVLLRDSLHLVRGKRVGLITNQSAIARSGESAIDALHRAPEVRLVALFSPEHGIRGNVEAGAKINTSQDEKTGLPIYSLYGKTQRPTDEMLQGVDVLLFDMQDIGARPYTFVWTMAMAMEEAARRKIPFVVLDRPNPITATADGPLMQMDVRNVTQVITGYYPTPLRHGMTAGEIARYYNAEAKVGAQLHVVPAAGYRGNTWFDQTGMRWVNPSPNIRSVDAALKYSGLVLAEATNVTVGRGTDAPFSYFGAPWLDAARLLEAAGRYNLPGVRLEVRPITPSGPRENFMRYRDTTFNALRLTVTDRDRYRPVYTALALLSEARKQNPEQFKITNAGFTQMIGSRWAREAFERGDDPREIDRRWQDENRQWLQSVERYRLYPNTPP